MYFDTLLENTKDEKLIEKIEEVSKSINRCIKEFLEQIESDSALKKYIKVFGLTGPMARGEGTLFLINDKVIGSDVDFVVLVTKPFLERKLRLVFDKVFKNCLVESSLMIPSQSIFKVPDLFFFEFVNSGKYLYGDLDYKLPIEKISKWEALGLLANKTYPFLNSFKIKNGINPNEKFYYTCSRTILACMSAITLIERSYVPSFKGRLEKFKESKIANGFLDICQQAYDYRFHIDLSFEKRKFEDIVSYLLKAWRLCLIDYFGTDNEKVYLEKLGRKRAPIPTTLITRICFVYDYWKKYKEIKFPIQEPFVTNCLMIIKLLKKLTEGKITKEEESLRQEIVKRWGITRHFPLKNNI